MEKGLSGSISKEEALENSLKQLKQEIAGMDAILCRIEAGNVPVEENKNVERAQPRSIFRLVNDLPEDVMVCAKKISE